MLVCSRPAPSPRTLFSQISCLKISGSHHLLLAVWSVAAPSQLLLDQESQQMKMPTTTPPTKAASACTPAWASLAVGALPSGDREEEPATRYSRITSPSTIQAI